MFYHMNKTWEVAASFFTDLQIIAPTSCSVVLVVLLVSVLENSQKTHLHDLSLGPPASSYSPY